MKKRIKITSIKIKKDGISDHGIFNGKQYFEIRILMHETNIVILPYCNTLDKLSLKIHILLSLVLGSSVTMVDLERGFLQKYK